MSDMQQRVARAICRELGEDPDEFVSCGVDDLRTRAERESPHVIFDVGLYVPRWMIRLGAARSAIDACLDPKSARLP